MAIGDTVAKELLSGSTSGRGIKVVQTATAGTAIHTAVAGAAAIDEVWLWALNTHSAAVDLTLEWGGTTDPDDLINIDGIAVEKGPLLICPGFVLNGGLSIAAFASQANVIVIFGFVNAMSS